MFAATPPPEPPAKTVSDPSLSLKERFRMMDAEYSEKAEKVEQQIADAGTEVSRLKGSRVFKRPRSSRQAG